MNKLSMGCGRNAAEPKTIRLDISPQVNPDIVWDLNRFPYPFDHSIFCEIECFDVIEHLADIPKTMEEIHRIAEPDGLLKITTPHFSCANSFVDPTHRWHLSYFSLDHFCEEHNLSYYSHARYRIQRRHIQFKGGKFSRSFVSRLANKFPQMYEQRWAWIFPAWFLYFELKAIK